MALWRFSIPWLVEELNGFTICPRRKGTLQTSSQKASERINLNRPKRCINLEFQIRKYPVNKATVKLKIS